MTKVIFIENDGVEQVLEIANGHTLMEAAVRNGVRGIEADCGGACACATCHVYVDPAWHEAVGEPTSTEAEMLEFAFNREPTSRLSCQIKITDKLDGLTVRLPESQH